MGINIESDSQEETVQDTIVAVSSQLYPEWELCIIYNRSVAPRIAHMLNYIAKNDRRIRAFRSEEIEQSAAANLALNLSSGDYVAFLNEGDVLPSHALFCMANAVVSNPSADLAYSDEDRLDSGRRRDPFFKPDWNPELFLAQDYIGNLCAIRTTLARRLGGFRNELDGSQHYDLVLRAAAATSRPVIHVPHVLYHRRTRPVSDPHQDGLRRKREIEAASSAVRNVLGRIQSVDVEEMDSGLRRVVRRLPAVWPMVTAIVPTRDRATLLQRCVEGLLGETDYPRLEIIIVDNDSSEPATLAYLREAARNPNVRVLPIPGEFNFSRLNNQAAREARGSVLLLLNNDISVIEPLWLQELVNLTLLERVGAVGARLLYPNDTIQHAGVVLGMGGAAGHIHSRAPRSASGYFGRLRVRQDVAAVTAACMALPRSVFESVGGFNEKDLAVAYNDVDLCLRIRRAGYRVIWTPHAELYHHESESRGSDYAPANIQRYRREIQYLWTRWAAELKSDPFYNPNLSLLTVEPELSFPPRVSKPWQGETGGA